MTTKVHIVNGGPNEVHIKTTEGSEPDNLPPGEHREVYVYPGQEILLTEEGLQPLKPKA